MYNVLKSDGSGSVIMKKISSEIYEKLSEMSDPGYAEFQLKLMPGIEKSYVIGVRTPLIRKYAKELAKLPETEDFLSDLPHRFYDENNLHGLIISECRDYEKAVKYIDEFLPFVNNWATCDQLNPKVFAKHRKELKGDILRWLGSDLTYTVRFGIDMAMGHFLDGDFDKEIMSRIAKIESDEYYINMAAAWYFATALTKQWDGTVGYIENGLLTREVNNKAIRKAIESYCITDEQKTYLRKFKR